MKKILLSFMLVMSLVLLVGFASAVPVCSGTVVGGTIYQNTITNPVSGATVTVTCNSHTQTASSESDGAYSVSFPCGECNLHDEVSVNAVKNPLTGENEGSVTMVYNLYPGLTLNVGIVNVPMVPEFGLIAGLTTVLGALGVFFVVRRKQIINP